MDWTILTALGAFLTGLAGIVGAVLSYSKSKALLEQRMEQVEKKLDAHNKYAEKLSEIAIAIVAI